MKKSFIIILIAGLVLGSSVLPAQAVDIVIHDNGTVSFYSSSSVLQQSLGEVLGDEDESDDEDTNEDEQEVESENDNNEAEKQAQERDRELTKKAQELQREAAKKQLEAKREAEKKQKELVREKAKKVRENLKDTKTEIRVKTSDKKVNVSLESKTASRSGKSENIETEDSLHMEIPRALKLPENEIENEEHPKAAEALRERTKKTEDHLDLKSEVNENGEQRLELTSGATRARIKNSDIVIDPATNNVSITSTNGEVRRLNHLPDQAIERIQALLELQTASSDQAPELELEIETKEDGSVVYTTESHKKKKLLGIFDRQIPTKVELNDDTGEISETELPATSAWENFLNRFSL